MSTMHETIVLHEQAAIGLLRDWTAYLSARLTLLAARSPASANLFEQDPTSDQHTAAERELAMLPPERRNLFERATSQRREQRRRQIEIERLADPSGTPRLLDPDELDRTVLNELLREAREPDESGHVLFPDADGARIEWLELRISTLSERPDPATYQAAHSTSQDRERQTRMAAGFAIIALLAFLGWYLLSPGSEQSAATAITANGEPLTPWRTARLAISGTTSLELIATSNDSWPGDGQAAIRTGVWPLQVCVPAAALTEATMVTLVGDGSVPDRIYALGETDSPPDLVISACEDASRQMSGILKSIQAAPLGTLGSTQPLSDGQEVTLAHISVSGPSEASDLPQGAARISLTLSSPNTPDWTTFAPTLRLGDGSQQSAPELRTLAEGSTELRFLVNTPAEALPAEFRLTDPSTRQVTRWHVPITAPIGRLQLLHNTLRVDHLTSSGQQELSVTITNTGAQPLAMLPTDLALDQDGLRQSLLSIRGIESPFAAGETRSLTLALPQELRGGATLSIGTALYQLSAP